ncbi:hypothetical protein H5410_026201 [Solanum commersonii]|uniref:LysM domain-containing protein n=1 Tax=Solanum commersonii TaxID=4109 RepID=A0A9J5YXZ5_SOLCO|nr:hypothetical protein H5410_026201 [Solanum commersonii]
MSSKYASLVLLVLLFPQFFSSLRNFVFGVPAQLSQIYPFPCSNQIKTCSSLLYQHNGLNKDQIATFYSVNKSQIEPIGHSRGKQDYLPGDTFPNVSIQIYSGEAWKVVGEEKSYLVGDEVTFHLVCGCGEKDDSKPIVTYTVQEFDSLSKTLYLVFQLNCLKIYYFPCSNQIKTCSSLLYQHNGLNKDQIATFYSVNKSQIEPIGHSRGKQDYLVTVPCTCINVNGTIGYFYDTLYTLRPGNTFPNVSRQIYSGEAWKVGGEEKSYLVGDEVTFHLVCGCGEKDDSKPIVTYTVQEFDSLSSIVDLLSSKVGDIEKLNPYLGQQPQFLDVGWLYVPKERS